ncbi:hypothetical protein EDB19DRAFT_1757511 [Suillus lakei]|nr:hypothetical protein EDB19DRAFT_1757511 [Suillus lakei]
MQRLQAPQVHLCERRHSQYLCIAGEGLLNTDFRIDEHPAIQLRPRFRLAHRPDVSKEYPLLSYAVQGRKHLEHVSDQDSDVMAALSRLNSEFLRNTKKHCVLVTQKEHYTRSWRQPTTNRWLSAAVTFPSLLFIPLFHGKPWMVEFIVKQQPHLLDVDITPGWCSPLIFAIAKNPDCLSILLKPGVDINKLSSIKPYLYGQYISDGFYAPISWATRIGREGTVNLLLSQPEVTLPDDILHMAVMASKPSLKLIHIFCQRDADVNFTVNGSTTPLHTLFFRHHNIFEDRSQWLPAVTMLLDPSCNLSLQDHTARTVLHNALDERLEHVVVYLLERGAGLSATATLLPDMWSWATNKTWFPKVQATALTADKKCTRTKGKVVDVMATSQLVEFPVAVTADRDSANPICAIVVSVIVDGEMTTPTFLIVISCFKRKFETWQLVPLDLTCTFHGRLGSVPLVACSAIIKETKLPPCHDRYPRIRSWLAHPFSFR